MPKGGRLGRGPHWGGLGCAIPVLLFVLAYLGGFPLAVLLALGIASVLAIVACLPWSSLVVGATGWLGTALHRTFEEAAIRSARNACAAAATALDRLLDRHESKPRHGIVAEFRHSRYVLPRYGGNLRKTVEYAVGQARDVVSVPPEVVRCAERPRSVADLEFLRDWLRRIADNSDT
jgi:hypothetical protein